MTASIIFEYTNSWIRVLSENHFHVLHIAIVSDSFIMFTNCINVVGHTSRSSSGLETSRHPCGNTFLIHVEQRFVRCCQWCGRMCCGGRRWFDTCSALLGIQMKHERYRILQKDCRLILISCLLVSVTNRRRHTITTRYYTYGCQVVYTCRSIEFLLCQFGQCSPFLYE